MLGGFACQSPALLLERLPASLEAEHDRWFLWLPVLFGAGIALYFVLPAEPLAARRGAAGRGGAGAAPVAGRARHWRA